MKAARRWYSWPSAVWLAAAGLFAPGCSLLFDLDADQCQMDADCDKFGGDLPICDAGLCVARTPPGGNGGASAAGAGGDVPAGHSGSGGEPGCSSNGQCIDQNFGQPFVCQEGQCIPLTTDECPLVIGAQNLRAQAPVIFGAYVLAPDGVSRSVASRNIDLVVSEFTSKVTGLRGGPSGSRTLAFVVCKSSFPGVAPGTIDAFEPSLEHLLETVRVPGILSALSAKDLQAVFAQRLDEADTFVISPYEQDSELAALSDEGGLWHLLGATSDLAPPFAPLLKRTETYLRRDESFLNLPAPGAKLRVALVTANIARETDVRDALVRLPELDDFEVEQMQIESALLTTSPDAASVAEDLLSFAPHIIVALAGSEFIDDVFPVLEAGTTWTSRTAGQQRPMYLLGSAMAAETWSEYSVKEGQGGGFNTLLDRIVGVQYASATNTELRDNYVARLIGANKDLSDPTPLIGTENVYDAAYLLIYAAAAAGEVPRLGGRDLALGMRRLLLGDAYDVGPMHISNVFTALDNGQDIGLRLTLGEPNWNAARGTRNSVGSVYCLNNDAFAYEGMFPKGPNYDALRYQPSSRTLEDKPLPCIPDF